MEVCMTRIRGVIVVPSSLTAFYRAGVKPLVIAILRDDLPGKVVEDLQTSCDGKLEILPSSEMHPIIIFPYVYPTEGDGLTPARFCKLLKQHISAHGYDPDIQPVAAVPEVMEQMAKRELQRSLSTSA